MIIWRHPSLTAASRHLRDSFSYNLSPADSVSSLGCPVNEQARHASTSGSLHLLFAHLDFAASLLQTSEDFPQHPTDKCNHSPVLHPRAAPSPLCFHPTAELFTSDMLFLPYPFVGFYPTKI